MAQASAADSRDQPSSNSAIASIRREARASWVRAAAARKSASVRSKRVIATVIAIPLLSQERRITPYRVAPIHLRVSGPGDWYHSLCGSDDDNARKRNFVGSSSPEDASGRRLSGDACVV